MSSVQDEPSADAPDSADEVRAPAAGQSASEGGSPEGSGGTVQAVDQQLTDEAGQRAADDGAAGEFAGSDAAGERRTAEQAADGTSADLTADEESQEPTSAVPTGRQASDAAGTSARSASASSAADGQEPPDLTEDATLDSALEALLLVVDVPAGEELLADTLEQPVDRIRTALQRLSEQYAAASRGFDLRRAGDGWRLYTRETYAPYVERYLLDGQRSKLTRAALETLAVIAYRQPVTRSRVAAVRGVNVDGVIRTLVGRGLVEEAGTDPETGGYLYCTTELFLERLGLSSLKDLPPLAPLLPEVDTIDDV